MRLLDAVDRAGRVKGRTAILTGLLILAVGSTVQAAANAMARSQDLQWSGVRLLLAHEDPWAVYLGPNGHAAFNMSQFPNYLPILYVLLVPIGWMGLTGAKITWLICNVVFAVASGVLAARFYGLGKWGTFAVACLMLAATPTRMTIGNGQMGLAVLFLWSVSLLSVRLTDGRSAVAGVSYLKFSFAPALFFYLLFRGGVRSVLMSALPNVAATLAVWIWLTGGRDLGEVGRLIFEPLIVSRTGYFPSGGEPNLMDAIQGMMLPFTSTPGWLNHPEIDRVTYPAAMLSCLVLMYFVMRRTANASVQWQVAVMATASYALFKHHDYDSVVLLLPLCYALSLWRSSLAQGVVGSVGFLWYVERIFGRYLAELHWFYYVDFVLVMMVLALTYGLLRYENREVPEWSEVRVTRT